MDIQQSPDSPLRELALFAGAGGGILGGLLCGWRTVCAVERDAYAAAVLAQRQNDGCLEPFPIWSDVETFDGKPWAGVVDVVSGGFPCQDISVAGQGKGLDGERSGLWKEMARIVREVRPQFVFVENSPALTSRGLGVVLGDLAELGFDAQWGVLGADDVGANHIRKRLWILAYAERAEWWQEPGTCNGIFGKRQVRLPQGEKGADRIGGGSEALVNSGRQGLPEPQQEIPCGAGRRQEGRAASECSWWATEPDVDRVVDGVANRVDRIKALGNGQVPYVAEQAILQLRRRITELAWADE